MMQQTGYKPLISVLVPIYNTAQYLHKCLYSILNQSYANLEVICINDGSTDHSLDIIKNFKASDDRIKIVNKPNSGYGASMNLGLTQACGHYIGIVESDDFIAPDMYEKLYSLSFNGTVDIVKGNFFDYYIGDPGHATIYVNREREKIESSVKPFTLAEIPDFSFGHPSIWSAIYKNSMINTHSIRFKEVNGGGWVDNPFFHETIIHAKSIMWTREPLYYYLKSNPTSSSNLQKNAQLPFDRMHDNLDVLDRNMCKDASILKCAYARALQYMTGVYRDFDCNQYPEVICELSQKLMKRFDKGIFSSNFNTRDQQVYLSALSPLTRIQASNPRILIYNWIPFDNINNWGGGVTIYCRNLIKIFNYLYPHVNVYFLSSGYAYDTKVDKPFIRKIDNCFFRKEAFYGNVQQYEVVNSPVPSPIDKLMVNPSVGITSPLLKDVFTKFVKEHGPFYSIHFNNIEGISLDILDLKADFPETKLIFSIHNYVPFCPHGFYYMRHAHKVCSPSRTGSDCVFCTRVAIKRNIAKELYDNSLLLAKRKKSCLPEQAWCRALGLDDIDKDADEEHILDYCDTAVQKINKNCDIILAVSERVKNLAIQNGLAKEKIITSYIGTEVAGRQKGEALAKVENGILRIVYLGNLPNMEEKGYPFLLSALSALDEKYARSIELVLTMRPPIPGDIKSKLRHFRSLKIIPGYRHEDLPSIFAGCHLSIVPVLWEDNLPQIAIESVAYGVPVLASSAGGASELCSSPLFIFEAGNSKDLLGKVVHFLNRPKDLLEYWKHHKGLTTMSEHAAAMYELYGLPEIQGVNLSAEDWAVMSAELMFYRRHFRAS